MNERRSLTEGIEPKHTPPIKPDSAQKQFVYGEKQPAETPRVLVSTRIRGDASGGEGRQRGREGKRW